ncbi:phosphatidylglycerophosphatase A family protein [Mucilaginibacter lacusdianchii]|uniref:phosphatidylglycerophosphatase A family protein n=1 Tax=Mucilaginibacter lacusdianchii TaxID=2684211 RepID=UPI001E34E150|nr:phosphatidylglycerophosphatase A [Mucilaginibacter sp. JXJ CY 39]
MIHKLIASWFGIGYIKGGGTIAAIVTCILIYLLQNGHLLDSTWMLPVLAGIITLIGIYVGNQVEPDWGEDSYRVVIDEVSGQMIALLFVPITPVFLIAALIFFRFFDILKPLYIRRMEKLPAGTGVMMDDVLAGVYANICMQVLVVLNNQYHWA